MYEPIVIYMGKVGEAVKRAGKATKTDLQATGYPVALSYSPPRSAHIRLRDYIESEISRSSGSTMAFSSCDTRVGR